LENNLRQPIDRSVALVSSTVYFVQGAVSIAAVAFPLFLREKGWEISQIATFSFVVGIPWTLKLLYGAASDGIPIGGQHRKPYIVLASILSTIAWIGLALFSERKTWPIYLFAILANFGFAFTDVVTDALIVEHSTESTTQIYQSLAWGFRSLGAVIGGFLGGWLAQNIPTTWIFAMTAALPMLTVACGWKIYELPRQENVNRPNPLLPLIESFRAVFQGDLKFFSFFLLCSSFSASYSTPFFFHLKDKLGFSETFLGSLSSLTWLGAIAACFLYGRFFEGVSLKKALLMAVALNTVGTLSSFLVINRHSAVFLSIGGGVIGYMGLLPLMAAAGVLSRQRGIEGSLFALLMSVHNLGQIVSTFIGGKLLVIIGLPNLIGLSAVVGLVGFIFISRLKLIGR